MKAVNCKGCKFDRDENLYEVLYCTTCKRAYTSGYEYYAKLDDKYEVDEGNETTEE